MDMKRNGVRSTVNPEWYWLKNLIGNEAILRIRYNPKQVLVLEEDGKTNHLEWQYDEEEVTKIIAKPVISSKDLEKKLADRYTYKDALVLLSRINTECTSNINMKRELVYTELKVPKEQWITTNAIGGNNGYRKIRIRKVI